MQTKGDLALLDEVLEHKSSKNITIFGSARVENKDTLDLAYKLAKKGYSIITGGGPGVMKNANYGAYLAKGEGAKINSIGINIKLPFEQHPNEYCDKTFLFQTLAVRKKALLEISDIFIISVGGFGTLDELFEIITLAQTRLRRNTKIIIFNQNGFYDKLFELFDSFMSEGVIGEESLTLFQSAKTIDEILCLVES